MPPRPSKRIRLSTEPDAGTADEKHQVFTQWATDRGVKIAGVHAASIPHRGIGLRTTRRIKEGETILEIPEKAMYKPDGTLLKREGLRDASPQAQLAFSAMIRFGSDDSALHVWKNVWPTNEDFTASLPMCWPEALRERLPPPVQQPLARQLADFSKDWKDVEAACTKNGFAEAVFKYYWMIVNSRSFHWKPPIAKGGIMVMCPFIDYVNHGPSGSGCQVTQSAAGYEVVADRKYESGEEILATYGAHSNDKLLVHYGFVCTTPGGNPSPDDEFRLDHIIMPKLTSEVRDQLQDVGFLGGYSLSASTSEICFKTEVAIRAILLTSNEWEYFIGNGEDLSEDQTGAVEEYVKDLLRQYRPEVTKNVQAVNVSVRPHEAVANDLTESRWEQIGQIIDSFLRA